MKLRATYTPKLPWYRWQKLFMFRWTSIGPHLVRVPDPLPQEMGRGTNVFKSGEFFFSGSHSSELFMDGKVWHQSGIGRISGSSMHCPIFGSPTDCCARAHFTEPPGSLQWASTASSEPPTASSEPPQPPVSLHSLRQPPVQFCHSISCLISCLKWNHISETLLLRVNHPVGNRVVSITTILIIFSGTLQCLHRWYER